MVQINNIETESNGYLVEYFEDSHIGSVTERVLILKSDLIDFIRHCLNFTKRTQHEDEIEEISYEPTHDEAELYLEENKYSVVSDYIKSGALSHE